MNEDKIRKKTFSILKQPAYKIWNMLKKSSIDSITSDEIRFLLEDIKRFLKNVYKYDTMLFFAIDYHNNGEENNYILNDKILKRIMEISSEQCYIHFLDKNANLLESKKIFDIDFEDVQIDECDIDGESIPALADLFKYTFIFSKGIRYEVYHCGRILDYSPIEGSQIIPGKLISKMKPISEYNEIIKDHFNECVRLAQQTDHWHNKANRILRDSCEDIFKKSLWYYMNQFSLDAIEVTPEFQLPSQSQIDILARTSKNDVYIFEVKVLGDYFSKKSKKGYNTYNNERVHEGMLQAKQYIEQCKEIKRGAVVVYDARKNQEDINVMVEETHIKLDLPIYLYLESDSATKIAHKKRKKIKAINY